MSPKSTRRRYLQAAATGLAAGVAGCSAVMNRNQGSTDGYDVILQQNFDYKPPKGDPFDVRIGIEVGKLTDSEQVGGEKAFQKTVELPPEKTKKRYTDAFSKADDVVEWVVSANAKALIGDDSLVVDDRVVDSPDTTGSDVYRFEPGGDRAPNNDVVVVAVDEDVSATNQFTIEGVSVSPG